MARTALTPIVKPTQFATAPVTVTYTAADAVNFNSVPLTGNETVVIKNTDGAAAHAYTIHSVADAYGRTGDQTLSIPASGEVTTQKFPVQGWQQSDGTLWIDCTSNLLSIAVLKDPV